MLARLQLARHADESGVSAVVVERDYVLSHALCSLSRQPGSDAIVLKGGTALRLLHFPAYRYSADLDFSLVDGLGPAQAHEIVRAALQDARERTGLPTLALSDDDTGRIVYTGPLGRERTIKLDVAGDELVENTERLPLIQRYADLPIAQVRCYALVEIAAEKLRCIIQRLQCRDLLDLHVLLVEAGVPAAEAWSLFERKARHRGLDPGAFDGRLLARTPEYSRRWDDELSEHVGDENVPELEAVLRAVRRAIRGR